MRNLQIIGEHTVDVSRLTGGWVLDAGCRDFAFSRGMSERGCKVIALDADPTIEDPQISGIMFRNLALAERHGVRDLAMTADPQARHLVTNGWRGPTARVLAITLKELMSTLSIEKFDVVKLDIEGAEYGILTDFPGPIASQVSIEFHEHCLGRPPDSVYDVIFSRLFGFGYAIIRHERDARMGAGLNFWDSLFMLKE